MLPGQQQQPPSSSVIDWPRVCLRLFGSVSHFFFFSGECVASRCRRRHFGNIPTIFSTVIASTAFHLVGVRTRSGGKKTKQKITWKSRILSAIREMNHTLKHTPASLFPLVSEPKKKRELSNEYHYANFLFFPLIFGIHDDVCAPPIDTRRTVKCICPCVKEKEIVQAQLFIVNFFLFQKQ